MKTRANFVILLMMAVSLTFLACGSAEKKIESSEQKVTEEVKYSCPMHPQIVSSTPAKCSICGMDLEKEVPTMHDDTTNMPGM